MPRLIVFAGLPASGKSTLAREVARRTGALWLRIDSMDQAIWASGTAPDDLQDWTYRAAQAVALDNLRLGREVVADCVNDWTLAREGWQAIGREADANVIWIEVTCSDLVEHQRRVETRIVDIPGLKPPDWTAVATRDFHDWDRPRLVVDTAGRGVAECLEQILAAL